ncbi:glycosyltransferase family 4 protein [Roseospira marina]|uniref:Glycosyltransferase family 4 protein n=2 Tax=Roseospira marina TaxID=140057 RepID=A0A5M6IFN9_9PROT|nr:glycosyltransferase family 4 protein [Roseospira marina]
MPSPFPPLPALILAGLLALIAAVLSAGAVWAVERVLRARALLDHPNERSSHAVPTPRGGGLGVLAAALPLLAWDALMRPEGAADGGVPWAMLAAGTALAALSWRDDLRPLPAGPRLAGHLLACAGVWLLLDLPGPVFQGLVPGPLDSVAAVLLWGWFVNLYNFMDGIDGITGVETGTVGVGLALVTVAGGLALPIAAPLILAGAAAGFLVWNWHPARIFLGDVGSVTLGYLLGGLLLMLAAQGAWAPALILPLYHLADASLTLLGRLARGHAPFRAHREHAYQVAVQAGLSHARVSGIVAAVNVLLIGLALLATVWTRWPPVIGAVALVLALLGVLRWRPAWLAARPAG